MKKYGSIIYRLLPCLWWLSILLSLPTALQAAETPDPQRAIRLMDLGRALFFDVNLLRFIDFEITNMRFEMV